MEPNKADENGTKLKKNKRRLKKKIKNIKNGKKPLDSQLDSSPNRLTKRKRKITNDNETPLNSKSKRTRNKSNKNPKNGKKGKM